MTYHVDYGFRNKIIGKFISSSITYCYQCASCTGVCPVALLTSGEYNPRKLIVNALLGLKEKLIGEKSPNVWMCLQCCSCDEICPQHVKLTEIFAELKNTFAEEFDAPEGFLSEARAVYENGRAVAVMPAITRRRQQLGLPDVPELDMEELRFLMDEAGLGELVYPKKKE